MALKQTTLRPGLLVRFNTAIRGNKKQTSTVIEALHITDAGEAKERIEVDKRASDPDEQADSPTSPPRSIPMMFGRCGRFASRPRGSSTRSRAA